MIGIDIGGNKLQGTIPASVGNFVTAKYVRWQRCQSSHRVNALPVILSPLHLVLRFLCSAIGFASNLLIGTVPDTFSLLTSLEVLSLGQNQLSGTLPTVIALLTAVSHLDLSRNSFAGTVPPVFGNLKRLT